MIACLTHNLLRWTTLIGLPGTSVRVARTVRRRLLARSWSDSGTSADPADDSRAAKAFRGLLRTRPQWLWLVAPGRQRQTYRLSYYEGERLRMEEVDDLPRFGER